MNTNELDILEVMAIAEKIANHTNRFEVKMVEKTRRMEAQIFLLEREINKLKKVSCNDSFTGAAS